MFSDKKNINILTSLLVAHSVRHVIVCPGSRNAPIVHNLNECKEIKCYPVTDERSAGFYALGMALKDDNPVAVCVTSGSALLNLVPSVAEASYRHHGIIVISADRPAAWIDQLDGQTLPQTGVFGGLVGKSVTLPEPHDEEDCWYCNRLVNEALTAVRTHGRKSVHINVPISEPLFDFSISTIPDERKIEFLPAATDLSAFRTVACQYLFKASRPMIVVGQTRCPDTGFEQALRSLSTRFAVLAETLSSACSLPFDLALSAVSDDYNYKPDFVLYIGDTLVSKRLKMFLRSINDVDVWGVSQDAGFYDTFMHVKGVVEGDAKEIVMMLAKEVDKTITAAEQSDNMNEAADDFVSKWNELLLLTRDKVSDFSPRYSQLAVVKEFEMSLEDMDYGFCVHYANSMSVRLANLYSWHYVWCNRGVNGIEGSLSTAAGHSLVTSDMVFCIIGDLSFFYDQNALWNTNIGGNLRVILLNNGCGGIFYGLKGLKDSPACDMLVAAKHEVTAQGICTQNDIGYLSAHDMDELHIGLATLLTAETNRPMLLEVFTDKDEDNEVMSELSRTVSEAFTK